MRCFRAPPQPSPARRAREGVSSASPHLPALAQRFGRLRESPARGKMDGMKTTIDSAGRLVIPKEIRKEAGIEPGTLLEVTLREGHIEIVPAPQRVRLVKKGHLLVAEPETEVPALDAETVDRTLKQLRQRRTSSR